jgi:hypothetical protein
MFPPVGKLPAATDQETHMPRNVSGGPLFEDNDAIVAAFGLPELPDPVENPDEYEDDGALKRLIIFQHGEERIYLDGLVTREDARAYCSRDDTHGDGWFVGSFDR